MTFRKNAFVNFLILTVAFNEVATWTIDLPEVRKFLFEKNEKYKKYNKNEYEDYLNSDKKFYSNIEGNSKHNSEDYKHENYPHENDKYADEYGYHTSYMEKKVQNIVRDGSSYLEGLRRSLEDYSRFLESCNRRNSTIQNSSISSNSSSWRPQYDPPSDGSGSPPIPSTGSSSAPILTFDDYNNSTVPGRPRNSIEIRSRVNITRTRNNRLLTCEQATESSEQVRRYAGLAMWATGRLQDLAYAKKYQKTDEQEENELILKLAWFLDRLAYLSGYEPEYKDPNYYEPRGTQRTPTTSPTPPTMVPSSDELTKQMMDCLKSNSSEPATERCRYPAEIPELMRRAMGGTTESTRPSASESVVPMNRPSDSFADQSSEILVTADNSSPNNFVPTSRISKRSTDYTYYYPAKPIHELAYPVPVVKLIKHRLSNIKTIVKAIVERRLQHLSEKKDEKHHFEKRSIDDTNVQTSNYVNPLSNHPKPVVKSVEKRPLDVASLLLNYPVSDVSVINTKSFKKRSIDERRVTSNHFNRLSNFKSVVKKLVKKVPSSRKKFEHLLTPTKLAKLSPKYSKSELKSVKKRFTDDPFSKLANYYIKYKVWDNSNPIYQKKNFNKKTGVFEVKNHLNKPKTIQKRSLFKKKVVHVHAPKPLQVVRTYLQGSKHNHKHSIHKPKLLTHLRKLHDLKHKKLNKIHKISKRSSSYYSRMYLPRESTDPQGDISYYIKNREGTNYNADLVQAGLVRLGLEQVFQTGNIEVVRRFGSNYNPLNPAPFYTGLLAGLAGS